jgi:hypothetical protein
MPHGTGQPWNPSHRPLHFSSFIELGIYGVQSKGDLACASKAEHELPMNGLEDVGPEGPGEGTLLQRD